MMRRYALLVSALVLAVVQIGFLSWMIVARAAVLRDGREVLLKVEPVDPRDLLRGDYVRLGYDISTIPRDLVSFGPPDEAERGADVYVRLRRQPDGFWGVNSAYVDAPPAEPFGDGEVELHGTLAYSGPDDPIRVDYGIERFYLPEGEGKPIERDMRVRSFGILAAVGPGGVAQIKALMDGDAKLFEEPLY
ncbi:GDYXXLXY domain-containing protein [Mesorhizobium sp. LHD-90]|uniref:GDYXXLXY domain-containing protein n=1 Tax=Mesorhizobium sp. LHD-90 TaxID=3071414 RepID=UPI0027DF7FFC|nr:GDYXXLXY domain-containing protein [Mesorhizobium sp. LHD-90]MDQ6432947.1 GDYXXLXY domain-containing protein [Mesorhizobium sp. LHD-90]